MGIDEVYEMVELGVMTGFIDQAGAWFTMNIGEEIKVQGKEKLCAMLKKDGEMFDKLKGMIYKVIS